MKTTLELEVKLWSPPNFVNAKNPDGVGQDFSIPLTQVDANTLERLCDEYRDAIFEKAGKRRPPQQAPICSKCGDVAK